MRLNYGLILYETERVFHPMYSNKLADKTSELKYFIKTFPRRDGKHDALLRRFVLAAVILILFEAAYILFLQWQIMELTITVRTQETRIAQTERDYDKHNHMLYTLNETITSIQRQWSSLNFRVLENTWKLDGTTTPQNSLNVRQGQ